MDNDRESTNSSTSDATVATTFRSRRPLLVLTVIGVALVAGTILLDKYSWQRMLLTVSPILVIAGVIVLKDLRYATGFRHLLPTVYISFVCLSLLTTGIVSRALNYNEYTGLFLEPGDKLYEMRYITEEDSDAIKTLDSSYSFFVNQEYARGLVTSQLLVHPNRISPIIPRSSGHAPYYVVSTNRWGEEHFVNTLLNDVLVIDLPDLKVWEGFYLLKGDLSGGIQTN